MLGVHFNLLDTTVLPFHVLPPFIFSIKLEHIVIGACHLVVSHMLHGLPIVVEVWTNLMISCHKVSAVPRTSEDDDTL
jgi:hypothetical protein